MAPFLSAFSCFLVGSVCATWQKSLSSGGGHGLLRSHGCEWPSLELTHTWVGSKAWHPFTRTSSAQKVAVVRTSQTKQSRAGISFDFLQGHCSYGVPAAGEGGESWGVTGHLGLPWLLISPNNRSSMESVGDLASPHVNRLPDDNMAVQVWVL